MPVSRFLFLGVASSLISTTTLCLINPIAVYTPLISITQAAQTASALQLLIEQPVAPQPSPSPTQQSSETSSYGIPLDPDEFGTHGEQLSTNGCYQLSGSVNFTGTVSPLVITQSNVIVDLNGQMLSYAGPQCQVVSAITISPGVTNVTIRNGTLVGFTGAAIAVNGSSTCPDGHITLDTIKIISCNSGISLSYTDHVSISNCTITGSTSSSSTVSGISAKNCSGVTIQHCTSQNNVSDKGSAYGYFFDTCKTVFLSQCATSGNQGTTSTAGIHFKNVRRTSYIQNSSALSNSSTSGECYGIFLENSQNCYVQNSTSQGNITDASDAYSYGILLRGSSNNFIRHNAIDGNNYGIYDDEMAGLQTNIYTQNIAYQNSIADYLRPYSSPFNFIQIQQDYLQKMLLTGTLDNLSIRISS